MAPRYARSDDHKALYHQSRRDFEPGCGKSLGGKGEYRFTTSGTFRQHINLLEAEQKVKVDCNPCRPDRGNSSLTSPGKMD